MIQTRFLRDLRMDVLMVHMPTDQVLAAVEKNVVGMFVGGVNHPEIASDT